MRLFQAFGRWYATDELRNAQKKSGYRFGELGWRRDLVLHQRLLLGLALGRKGAANVDRFGGAEPTGGQREARGRLVRLEFRPVTSARTGNGMTAADLRHRGPRAAELGRQGDIGVRPDQPVNCLASKP